MNLSRISSCTYPLRERDLDYTFTVLAEAGLKKIDLWGGLPHFSIVSTSFNLAEARQKATDQGLTIANIGSYPGYAFTSEDPTIRAAELECLRATLLAAKALGARSIRVMPGHGEDPAIIDVVAPYFAEGAKLAEDLGVYMGMENHGGSLAGFPKVVKRLCEVVGSKHFGVLYEPSNLMHKGEDYQAAFETFANHIVHIHVKDGRQGTKEWERCHLGEGEIDYAWVIQQMESLGYEGDYALEYEICDIEPIETGMKKWVNYFMGL